MRVSICGRAVLCLSSLFPPRMGRAALDIYAGIGADGPSGGSALTLPLCDLLPVSM